MHQSCPAEFGSAHSSLRSLAAATDSELKGDCLKTSFLFIFVVVSPNAQFAAASAIWALMVQADVSLPHVMSKALNKAPAQPWQVVPDAGFQPHCKNSQHPLGNGN